jgi:prepilin-type N-terminal cleavage/methylation domain-containing protein
MNKNNKSGFTLLEMMVVILIIGIISSMTILNNMEEGRNQAKFADLKSKWAVNEGKYTEKLIGKWSFDEGTGTNTKDNSTFTNNCTLTNGVTWKSESDCVSGKCLSFDGTDDYLDCGNNISVNSITGQLTLQAWVYPRESEAYGYVISNTRDCCGTYNGYSLRISNGFPRVEIWNGTLTALSSTIAQNLNQWNYIVGVFDGSTIKVYVNGVLGGSTSFAGTIGTPASYNLAIGAMGYVPGTYNINGMIDEPAIYNTTMTLSQIRSNYVSGLDELLAKNFITREEYGSKLAMLNNNILAKE